MEKSYGENDELSDGSYDFLTKDSFSFGDEFFIPIKCQNCSGHFPPLNAEYHCESCSSIKYYCSDCKELHDKCIIFQSHVIKQFDNDHEPLIVDKLCHNCSKVAKKKCVTCPDIFSWFCEDCSILHNQLKAFINHSIVETSPRLDPVLGDGHIALIKSAELIADKKQLSEAPCKRGDSIVLMNFIRETEKRMFVITKPQILTLISLISGVYVTVTAIENEISSNMTKRTSSDTKKESSFRKIFSSDIETIQFQNFFFDVLEARFGKVKKRQTLQEYNRLKGFYERTKTRNSCGLDIYIEKCLTHIKSNKLVYLRTLIDDLPHLLCSFTFTRYFRADDDRKGLFVTTTGVMVPFEHFQSYYHFIYPKPLGRADVDAVNVLTLPHERFRKYEQDTFPYAIEDKILYFINYPRAMGDAEAQGPRVFALQRIPDVTDDMYEYRYLWYVDDNTMTYRFYNSACDIKLSSNIVYRKDGLLGNYRSMGNSEVFHIM